MTSKHFWECELHRKERVRSWPIFAKQKLLKQGCLQAFLRRSHAAVTAITPSASVVADTHATAMPVVSSEIPFSAPPHLCEVLEAIGAESTAAPGSFLFHRGDNCQGVFVIKSGRVRLSMETHRSVLERTAGPGCVLGLPAAMSGKPYSLTAEVIEITRYIFVDVDRVRHTLIHNPELCFEVLGLLSREVQQLRERL